MTTVLGTTQRKAPAQPHTIPGWVEDKLGLQEGDALLFLEENGRVFLQREARRPLEEVLGSIKTDRPFPSDVEMDAAVEQAVADHYREKWGPIEGPG